MPKRSLLLMAAGAVIGLALIGSVTLLIGAYYLHWEGGIVRVAADALPIPAATLGKRTVRLRDYLDEVHSVKTYLTSPEAEIDGQVRAVTLNDKQEVLERLLQEQALKEIAEVRNIQVTEQQMQAAMSEIAVTSTSTEAFAAFLQENFAWTLDDFKTHMVEPAILKSLLEESYAADHGNDLSAFDAYLAERLGRNDVIRYVKFY